jgi:hypothetical protein
MAGQPAHTPSPADWDMAAAPALLAPIPLRPEEVAAAFDLADAVGAAEAPCYLNAAGRSALLREAHDAACAGVAMKLRPWTMGDAPIERARRLFARGVGCAAADVALTPSAAYAVSTVAANVRGGLRAGSRVICLQDHYASVLPCVPLPEKAGCTLSTDPLSARYCRPCRVSVAVVAARAEASGHAGCLRLRLHSWQHAVRVAGAELVPIARQPPPAAAPDAAAPPTTASGGGGGPAAGSSPRWPRGRRLPATATRAILRSIDARTAVVCAPPCGWTDGEVIDLAAIGRACRRVGAALVVDATQWVGAMPFDVREVPRARPPRSTAQRSAAARRPRLEPS